MLRVVTALIQLFIINVEATGKNKKFLDNLGTKNRDIADNIQPAIDLSRYGTINHPKDEAVKHVQKYVEPLFKDCENNIKPLILNPKYEVLERFIMEILDSDMIIKELEKNPNYTDYKNMVERRKREIGAIVSAGKILKLLIDKRAIPTIQIGDKVSFSINGMIKYMFYSLYILLGEKKFRESKEIKDCADKIKEIRNVLNEIAKAFYDNGKFKRNVNLDYSRFGDNIGDFLNFDGIFTFLENTDFEDNGRSQETACLSFINTNGIIFDTVISILSYAELLDLPGEWINTNTTRLREYIKNFKQMVVSLVIFAVQKSIIDSIVPALEDSAKIFRVSKFNSTDGDFDKDTFDNWTAIEDLIDGCMDPKTGLGIWSILGIIAGITFLLFLIGAIAYQLRRKGKR